MKKKNIKKQKYLFQVGLESIGKAAGTITLFPDSTDAPIKSTEERVSEMREIMKARRYQLEKKLKSINPLYSFNFDKSFEERVAYDIRLSWAMLGHDMHRAIEKVKSEVGPENK